MSYNPLKIEEKWQKNWEKLNTFKALDKSKKPKFYALVEFPYPSGEGLHVGHCRSYIAMDVLVRKRRMNGYNVLFPMGWDAFGLPTENYAIKTGISPKIATKKNTDNFRKQEKSLGLSFDWPREVDTTDPDYYKWTQWIFLQFYKHNLAYKAKIPINWCPSCKIGLANEEVINGNCERCGAEVTKKEKEQWMLKITKYAQRLINDLDKVNYPEKVKTLQRDWIGKSEGWEIKFNIKNEKQDIKVFTTRIDTLFGATYLVLAPEHPVIEVLKNKITNHDLVKDYIEKSKKKTERERTSETKEKTGIEIKGIKAINPVNNEEISIWVADYVLPFYGTGAIMAVPAHDQRDYEFAQKYSLPIVKVIDSRNDNKEVYEGEGILINSGDFNGQESLKVKEKIGQKLGKLAQKKINYKLRDWVFSRQRYWGEPIPMINCEVCGWVPVLEKDLPVKLPEIKKYQPTETGESPLSAIESWINVLCPKCKGKAKRETDVMPNWAGSNWYFLRYCDPKNKKQLADFDKLKYWMPVDWYNGGMEHATLHLLYSRFVFKFLWDIEALPKSLGSEPYKKRTSHGMILGEGGIKMSKSRGNVVNPDEIVKTYGADAFRLYEMFIGPFEEAVRWQPRGIRGMKRFLEKVWISKDFITQEHIKDPLLHQTIKKVTEDIEELKFNTAISAMMILLNDWLVKKRVSETNFSLFLKIFAPFAPHISEELWQKMGNKKSIFKENWPVFDKKLVEKKVVSLVIQINGRVRDKIEIDYNLDQKEAEKIVFEREIVKKWIENKKIKKVIFVLGKLINIVLE